MTSTNVSIGLVTETRSSSRVLKPPGGGHSNIFDATDPNQHVYNRRPKNNQQNSAGMSAVMGVVDANERRFNPGKIEVDVVPESEPPAPSPTDSGDDHVPVLTTVTSQNSASSPKINDKPNCDAKASSRQRVPPGGFSSGLW